MTVKDAFTEMGFSVKDRLVSPLTKLGTTQDAMDNRLSEISNNFKQHNTTWKNQLMICKNNQS